MPVKLVPAKIPDLKSFHKDAEVISTAHDYLADDGIYYEQNGRQILEFLIESTDKVVYIQQFGNTDWFKISTILPNDLLALFNEAIEQAEADIEEERDRFGKKR